MAQINKPGEYFNTVLYTGNGTARDITTGLTSTDWVWIKRRDNTANHRVTDVVRGATNMLSPNNTNATQTNAQTVTAFGTNTFSLGTDSGGYDVNTNSQTYASWSWSAAGSTPSNTYIVKVVSDSGNKYRFDDFGTSAVTLEISEGGTYRFDQSDSSNSGHPLRFSTTSDGTHNSGTEYTTGVTTNGTPGSSGAYTEITVAASAPTLYYYCSAHSGMGGTANTPTTNSFSNFDGSIQSNVSPNSTSLFSIVTYTGNGTSGATVGHGLSVAPDLIIVKSRSSSGAEWASYWSALGATKSLKLNGGNSASTSTAFWNDTAPTSSVFSLGNGTDPNQNTGTYVAYCFAAKKGFSKFGSYAGNNSANGTFVYTGFKPAFVIVKRHGGGTQDWMLYDNKRLGYNGGSRILPVNTTAAEGTSNAVDLLSNGFKMRTSDGNSNGYSDGYVYMAFAEEPLVGTNNVPATAR